MQPVKSKNAILSNVALASTSILLALACMEGAVRLLGNSPRGNSPRSNSSNLGRERAEAPLAGVRYLYEGHSSYQQTWPDDPRGYFGTADHSLTYRVNNYGFRGADFEIARNARIRIAAVGDSFCWGTGVEEADSFTFLLEERLNREEVLGETYEIYNFCLPAFNTVDEVNLYEQVITHFRPDLLLVSFFLNDVSVSPQFGTERGAGGSAHSRERYRPRLRLVEWIGRRIDTARARPTFIEGVKAAYERGQPGYEAALAELGRLGRLNRQEEVSTLLVIWPWLTNLEFSEYPFHEVHEAVARAVEVRGFEIVDLFGVFEGHAAAHLWVHTTDQHPNEVAHRMAANAIYERLAEVLEESGDGLLDAAARRRRAPPDDELVDPSKPDWYRVFADLGRSGREEGQ